MRVAYQQRVYRPLLDMLFLLTLVFSSTFGTNCPRPGYEFYSSAEFLGLTEDGQNKSSFEPGTRFEGRCYNEFSIDTRTCLSNGSWSIGSTNCSIDVLFGKPVKDLSNGSFVEFGNQSDVIPPGKFEIYLAGSYRVTSLSIELSTPNSNQDAQIFLISRRKDTQTFKPCFLSEDTSRIDCELDKTTHIQVKTTSSISQFNAFTTDTRPAEQFGKRANELGILLGETFLFSKKEACFDTAREDCQSVGGKVLDSWTDEEWELLRRYNDSLKIWIGLKVTKTGWIEKKWIWLNESELEADNARWESTEGATPMRGHAVVVDLTTGLWTSVPRCSIMYHFVCRLETPKNCLSSMAGSPERGRLIGYCEECQQVTYKCDDGYFMKGDPHRDCGENGKWFEKMPECLTAVEISETKCSSDSIFGPGEEENCDFSMIQKMKVVESCHCPVDKLRHPTGNCVDFMDCPVEMVRGNCSDDQIFAPWFILETSCITTEIPWIEETYQQENVRRCICKKDLVRDQLSGKCIEAENCAKT